MLTEKELLEKIIKQKEREKLNQAKEVIKTKQKSTKKIKPTSGFNAGWMMGAYSAYETCLNILNERCGDETDSKE